MAKIFNSSSSSGSSSFIVIEIVVTLTMNFSLSCVKGMRMSVHQSVSNAPCVCKLNRYFLRLQVDEIRREG